MEENIKDYICIDNRIRKISQELKELRKQKIEKNDEIFRIVKERRLGNSVINVTDSQLFFYNRRVVNSVSLKEIKKILDEELEDNKADYIYHKIRQSRKYKNIDEIKRVFT